jgi:hypothetical protein
MCQHNIIEQLNMCRHNLPQVLSHHTHRIRILHHVVDIWQDLVTQLRHKLIVPFVHQTRIQILLNLRFLSDRSETGVILQLKHGFNLIDVQILKELLCHFLLHIFLPTVLEVLVINFNFSYLITLPVTIPLDAPVPQKVCELGIIIADLEHGFLVN